MHFSYSAAYNSPLIVRNDQLLDLPTDKMPVGYGEISEPFSLFTYPLQKGDIIYVYTDGYADQFGGPKGKKFKYKQLNDLLLSIRDLPLEKQSGVLTERFNDWKGSNEQVDDVLIAAIKI
jgi:serine phosphatase RsbU (regulator of sigma subunit)